LPTALAVQVTLALLGCHGAASPDLAPDPVAHPLSSDEQIAAPEVIVVTLNVLRAVHGAGIARTRAVIDDDRHVTVKLRVRARDVPTAADVIRTHAQQLDRCGEWLLTNQRLRVRLHIDSDGIIRRWTRNETDDDKGASRCLGEALSSMPFPDACPDSASIDVELEIANLDPPADAGATK
jgi:hypothetical protein